MKRGLIDRLTNRDIMSEQKTNIDFLTREIREKNELVTVQAAAIDEFMDQVTALSEEISELWNSVNSMPKKRSEKNESENN